MERRMTRSCGEMFLLLFQIPRPVMVVEWNRIIEAWDLTQVIQWFLRGGPDYVSDFGLFDYCPSGAFRSLPFPVM
jgi:hypothetical protein